MKKLHAEGRYLFWDDGRPFFYLGDTAWELVHRLNREEIAHYMAVRARQGFTAVQTVALAELGGLRVPNAYGRLPLLKNEAGLPDPSCPDTDGEYSYWDHVDYAVKTAAEHGLFIALLPTWGDKFCKAWGEGPEIFTVENARTYGKWIGKRYASCWNIIWMLGGDRHLDANTRRIVDSMAAGILEADPNHLITFHPVGERNSIEYVGDADYIDFHTAQTSHGVNKGLRSDAEMRAMALKSSKPYMDSEPRYEDHPACFNAKLGYYWTAAEVRQNAYWNVLAGTCGHTYGNHAMWCCNTEPGEYFPYHWKDVLTHPGAEQIGWVKQLRMRGDYASFRAAPELVEEQYEGAGHLAAGCGNGYAYVYSPLGAQFTVRLSTIAGQGSVLRAYWFNPRTGEESIFGIFPSSGKSLFVPPTGGYGEDWILILEEAK